MKRLGYKQVVEWLAYNDDNSWLKDMGVWQAYCYPSIVASMVIDLYEVSIQKLGVDIKSFIEKKKYKLTI